MAEEVGALRVSVRANAAEIQSDMGKISSIVNSASAKMQRSMMAFQVGASKAVGEIFNLRNAVIGLAGGAFISLVKRSLDYADSLGEQSDAIGITTKSLQELRYAFGLNGASAEQFDKAIQKLSSGLGDAAKTGVSDVATALGKLGISLAMVKGLSPDQVLKMIADRMPAITDATQRASIANDLFGKGWQKLMPTLLKGSGFLAQAAAEANKLGLVLSNKTLQAASDANDEFDRISGALKVAGVNLAVGLLPALKELRQVFTSPDFQQGVKNIAADLSDLVNFLVKHKDAIVTVTGAFTGMRLGAAVGGLPGAIVGGGIGAGIGAYLSNKGIDEIKQAQANVDVLTKKLAELQGMAFQESRGQNDRTVMAFYAEQASKLEGKLGQATGELEKLKAEAAAQGGDGSDRPRVVVNAGQFFSPEVKKAIDDAAFQTRILNGEFNNLADGFPQAVRGMNLFGSALTDTIPALSSMPPQVRALNDAMLALQAAKIIDSLKSSTQKAAEEIQKLNVIFDNGKKNPEAYAQAVAKIKFPSIAQAIDDAGNLNKMLDSFAVHSVDATVDALYELVSGTKSAKDAFTDLARSVAKDLFQMTLRALLFKNIIGPLFGFSGGGMVSGFRDGGVVHAAGGGMIRGPGTGRSDSIPAMLSDQEYVVRAAQSKKHRGLLDAINSGAIDKSGGGAAPVNVSNPVKIVNAFDSIGFLSEALGSSQGERVLLNFVRANPGAFRAAMSG